TTLGTCTGSESRSCAHGPPAAAPPSSVLRAFQTALLPLKPEPKAICQAVAAADPALGLAVGELVPERAARRVAEAVERHPRRLHVPGAELEAALQLVEHAAAAGVDAE
uniref:Uncharacterized protein n=1 Tax=Oryza brachyantha TaxID=4533 RepID=J3LK99_ORYBR